MSPRVIFAHTHWDREWFERADTTKPLLIPLFKNLFWMVEEDPKYYFILDGQTVMIQDYLSLLSWSEKREAVRKLKKLTQNLSWGPFYGQIDWRIGEESAIEALEEGVRQAKVFGIPFQVGWLLDNFGLTSQIPQILNSFGITCAVVWRGVPLESPTTEFRWISPDGSSVRVLYALDSYRNLMRIGDYPEVAQKRVSLAVQRLRPYARSQTLPLFNGYDLDPKPENPSNFGDFVSSDPQICLAEESLSVDLPTIRGELRCGRFVCVFPGSLSTRIQLKQMHRKLEDMISRQLQPLNSLRWLLSGVKRSFRLEWQLLLKNLIHDSIGGVGTDVVHREMEFRYQELYERCLQSRQQLLDGLSPYLSEGYYMWNLQPIPITVTGVYQNQYLVFSISGGRMETVEPTFEQLSTQEREIKRFYWYNKHYSLLIEEGTVTLIPANGEKRNLRFSIFEDAGDTYSSAFGREVLYQCTGMTTLQQSASYTSLKLRFESPLIRWEWIIECEQTPVIKMKANLWGRGVGYALILTLTGEGDLTVYSPFDTFERPPRDFHKEPEEVWQPFLVAARETGLITEFSFKDFVGYRREGQTTGWFSSLYGYTTVDNGAGLILTRSVDFLSKPEVPGRIGDAGPYMYTPQAATKGEISHTFSLYCGTDGDFPRWKSAFSTPPILFRSQNHRSQGQGAPFLPPLLLAFFDGGYVECTTVKPLPSGSQQNVRNLGFRVFNPGNASVPLSSTRALHSCGIRGDRRAPFTGTIRPKAIETIGITFLKRDYPIGKGGSLSLLIPDADWVKPAGEAPVDPTKIQELVRLRDDQEKLAGCYRGEGMEATEQDFQSRFAYYKAKRTALELSLSLCQHSRATSAGDLEIKQLFSELNDLRIKRRSIELLIETLKSEV